MSTVKESSDELNPSVAIPATEIAPRARRRVSDYLALAIATCGVGYFPIAPGTVGSLVGVGLYLALWGWLYAILEANAARAHLDLLYIFTPQLAFMLFAIFVVSVVGIWAASRAEKADDGEGLVRPQGARCRYRRGRQIPPPRLHKPFRSLPQSRAGIVLLLEEERSAC